MTLLEQLQAILAVLDGAGIEYALSGGLTGAGWGAPRATQNFDLLVRPESVDAIVAAIEPLGFRFRALPMTVSDGMIWVISREALIQMTLAAGRTRDVQDIERLEEIDR